LTGKHNWHGDYVVPSQNIEPWVTVLNDLMKDKEVYESVSDRAREDTAKWLTELDEHSLETWLEAIEKKKKK